MAEEILMPKLGFDMAEGKLIRWLVKDGDAVEKGTVMAEIETDKATVELEAFNPGTIRGLFAEEDTYVPVGALIGVMGTPDEAIDLAPLKARAQAEIAGGEVADAAPEAGESAVAPAPEAVAAPAVEVDGNLPDGVRASPLARRVAEGKGVDIRRVSGSGPRGRIVRADVEGFLESGGAAPAVARAPAPSFAPMAVEVAREDEEVPLTPLRKAIARRMVESKTTIPHFYVTMDIDMGPLMAIRGQANALLAEEDGPKLSVNDFIVKAAALALRKFPNLNAVFAGDRLVRKGNINIGVAVAVEAGLLTVVVQNADLRSLADISASTKEMAARARDGKVRPADVDGSTFTTSNLGMYGVDQFVAIVSPPEAAILAIGGMRTEPVVVDGEVRVGQRMRVTISVDHRASDGAEAAQYLQEFKRIMENPVRLML